MDFVEVEFYSEAQFRKDLEHAEKKGDADLVARVRRKWKLSEALRFQLPLQQEHVTSDEKRVLREMHSEKFAEEIIECLIAIRNYSDYGKGIRDPKPALIMARKYASAPDFVRKWDEREDFSWAKPMIAAAVVALIFFLAVATIQ